MGSQAPPEIKNETEKERDRIDRCGRKQAGGESTILKKVLAENYLYQQSKIIRGQWMGANNNKPFL